MTGPRRPAQGSACTCSAVTTCMEDVEKLDVDVPPAMTRSGAERGLSIVAEPSTTNDASSSVCVPVLSVGSMALQSNAPLAAAGAVDAGERRSVSIDVERELQRRDLCGVGRLLCPAEAVAGRDARISGGNAWIRGFGLLLVAPADTDAHNGKQDEVPHRQRHDSPPCARLRYDKFDAAIGRLEGRCTLPL